MQHPETKDEVLLVGAEDKKLSVYVVPYETSETPFVIAEMIGHTNRCAVALAEINVARSDLQFVIE